MPERNKFRSTSTPAIGSLAERQYYGVLATHVTSGDDETMVSIHYKLILVAALAICAGPVKTSAADRPPNVVLILTDNQGAWTLDCYGNADIRTPNIDRLAREGTLFEHCYSSNAVCSPTRATLLTGLMPSQHGVHSYLATGEPQIGPRAYSTIAEFRTLPEILADAGYICGLCGKWHLGDNLKPQEGFSYWVTMPEGHTRTFYNADVIEDGKVRKEPEYLTDFWTDHAVRFIEQNKDRPFFLYLSYNGPYGLGQSMLEPSRNRHAADYADKEMKSFPREKMDARLAANKQLLNNVEAMRRYAAEISGVDDGVGRILEALETNKIADNTLVIFTADQGLAGGQNGFWGMGDHTRPLSAFDWATHVPLIYRHPGNIRAGQRSDILVSNYDFAPTVLDYLGLKDKTPQKPQPPGRSYSAFLNGKSPSRSESWDNTVFFEFETTRAIRTPDWKYVGRFPEGPNELYDLKIDPAERHNLVDQAAYAAKQKELRRRLDRFFNRYALLEYDLTRGGKSKAPRRSK
jgi:arylsulfatase A-like enzyme